MNDLSPRELAVILRSDLGYFAERCFYDLNPQAAFLTNWHIEVIAAKLAAVREGKIRRLIINLPPRHLKSLLASIAFPALCLGHDPSAQILCVSYAQDLADKLTRDCRSIMMSPWYRRIFATRLALHRHAVQAGELGALTRLDDQARQLERHATGLTVQELIVQERQHSPSYGGRSVFGWEHGQASAKIGHSYGR